MLVSTAQLEGKRTSKSLIAMLGVMGITHTGNAAIDVKLARKMVSDSAPLIKDSPKCKLLSIRETWMGQSND